MKPSADFMLKAFNGKVVDDTDNRTQVMFKFENGLGASVIWSLQYDSVTGTNYGSYGAENLRWELAVVKYSADYLSWKITYDYSEVTSDVLGYLTDTGVLRALRKIKKIVPRA